MNVDRLVVVRDQILAEPDRLDMDDYVSPRYDQQKEFCGTALCIAARAALDAGYARLRTTPRPGTPATFYDVTLDGTGQGADMQVLGAAALWLTDKQAGRLFYLERWPNAYWHPFMLAKAAPERARICARRIDHFLKTEGAA